MAEDTECYIVVRQWTETRKTLGRGQGGWKTNHYEVELYLQIATSRDDSYADTAMFTLIDAIQQLLRNLPLPTNIEDPTTAAQSSLMAIGERFTVDVGERRNLADERLVREVSLIQGEVIEWFQQ